MCDQLLPFIKRIFNHSQKRESDNDFHIFSLAYDDYLDLNQDKAVQEDFKVYQDYLKKVFENPKMCNIAVTGNFGVGKSSVVHTFERIRHRSFFRRFYKREFLYVSLTNFRNWETVLSEGNTQDGQGNIGQDALERELLCQILSACNGAHLTDAYGNVIHMKKRKIIVNLITVASAIMIGCIYAISFSEQISLAIELLAEQYPFRMLLRLIQNSQFLYSSLYWVTGIGTVIVFSYLCLWVFSHARLKEIQIETTYAKASIETTSGATYLDEHKWQMIHALESVASKIDFTVVFEDMDRLNKENEQNLYAQLREINQLLNMGLKTKMSPKKFRFLYLTKDEVFENYDTKFFDCIMPIVPSLSEKGLIERMAKNYLPMVGIYMNFQDKNEDRRPDRYFKNAGMFLNDYRMIYAILNEYQVFAAINERRGLLNEEKKLNLLAMVIYKRLCPDDYYKIKDGTSVVFGAGQRNRFSGCVLVDHFIQIGMLPLENIYFLGYSLEILRGIYKGILLGDSQEKKRLLLMELSEYRENCNELRICAEILFDIKDELLGQVVIGVEFVLVQYLLKVSEMTRGDEGYIEKIFSLLTRTMGGGHFDVEGEKILNEVLSRGNIIKGYKTEYLAILIEYLCVHQYKDRNDYQWIFNTDKEDTMKIWDVLFALEEKNCIDELDRNVMYQWLIADDVLVQKINEIENDNMSSGKLLSIIKKAIGDKSLPSRLGEIKLVYNGQTKSLMNWLSIGDG